MDYAGHALSSVENSWTAQSAYHSNIFLVKPFKLVWLCEPLPPIKIDFSICVDQFAARHTDSRYISVKTTVFLFSY